MYFLHGMRLCIKQEFSGAEPGGAPQLQVMSYELQVAVH